MYAHHTGAGALSTGPSSGLSPVAAVLLWVFVGWPLSRSGRRSKASPRSTPSAAVAGAGRPRHTSTTAATWCTPGIGTRLRSRNAFGPRLCPELRRPACAARAAGVLTPRLPSTRAVADQHERPAHRRMGRAAVPAFGDAEIARRLLMCIERRGVTAAAPGQLRPWPAPGDSGQARTKSAAARVIA